MLATRDVRPLVRVRAPFLLYAWSPDSGTIAYSERGDVWLVDVATGRRRLAVHKRAGEDLIVEAWIRRRGP